MYFNKFHFLLIILVIILFLLSCKASSKEYFNDLNVEQNQKKNIEKLKNEINILKYSL